MVHFAGCDGLQDNPLILEPIITGLSDHTREPHAKSHPKGLHLMLVLNVALNSA